MVKALGLMASPSTVQTLPLLYTKLAQDKESENRGIVPSGGWCKLWTRERVTRGIQYTCKRLGSALGM